MKMFDIIEPNNIQIGSLGDGSFLSALAIIAERPSLIRQLFITQNLIEEGIYRLKFCKFG